MLLAGSFMFLDDISEFIRISWTAETELHGRNFTYLLITLSISIIRFLFASSGSKIKAVFRAIMPSFFWNKENSWNQLYLVDQWTTKNIPRCNVFESHLFRLLFKTRLELEWKILLQFVRNMKRRRLQLFTLYRLKSGRMMKDALKGPKIRRRLNQPYRGNPLVVPA